MRHAHRLIALALALTGLAATGAAAAQAVSPQPAAAPELHYANKWRMQVSEGANNDGVMNFRLTPKGGTPIDIPVRLKKGRGEDGCARDIRDAFKKALDKKVYKVEIDDGEDVLVKKHKGPDFSVQLIDSNVKGTRINFDRE